MRRYLVVANQTLLGDPLVSKIRECLAAGPCRFHVVVPATHVTEHLVWTEGHDRAVASRRLAEALDRYRSIGAEVDGEVGDASAIEAIGDAMRHTEPFDQIILSSLPPGVSRWLRQDLPHRIERAFGLPVALVVSTPVAAA
jgi:hypothetical protein